MGSRKPDDHVTDLPHSSTAASRSRVGCRRYSLFHHISRECRNLYSIQHGIVLSTTDIGVCQPKLSPHWFRFRHDNGQWQQLPAEFHCSAKWERLSDDICELHKADSD